MTPRFGEHNQPAVRCDAFALLEGVRDDNGTVARRIDMGYATARRPDGTPP